MTVVEIVAIIFTTSLTGVLHALCAYALESQLDGDVKISVHNCTEKC